MVGIGLEVLHGPQRGQEGSEQGCSERQPERGGSIAQVCCATPEGAGVAGPQQGPSEGGAAEV